MTFSVVQYHTKGKSIEKEKCNLEERMKLKQSVAIGLLSSIALVSNMQNVEGASFFPTEISNEVDTSLKFNVSDIYIDDEYDDLIEQFEKMTDSELNQYIALIMNQNSPIENHTSSNTLDTNLVLPNAKANILKSSYGTVETAWLAAAQILSNNGYKCTAELITFSVKGLNYTESSIYQEDGLFTKKIVKTSVFKSFFSKLKSGKKLPKGLEFKQSDDKDLYLALHNTDISSEVRLPNTAFTTYHFVISDTYDFKKSDYENVMVGLVNNFAWLCQNTGVLKNINVKIYFMR